MKISPTRALLLLLENRGIDVEKKCTIARLLFIGRTPETAATFDAYMTEAESSLASPYTIDRTPTFIHTDPIRRYFETHVAYSFLKKSLAGFDSTVLQTLLNNCQTLFPQDGASLDLSKKGNEFANAMHLVTSSPESSFSSAEKAKLIHLLHMAFQGVEAPLTPAINAMLPLNLHSTDVYSTGRGRARRTMSILEMSQRSTTTSTCGIMRATDPLPMTDEAEAPEAQTYKAPDRSDYIPGVTWTEASFAKLTDPFVNSISGTMLCQLRIILDFQQRGLLPSEASTPEYFLLIASTCLFFLGGHSYNEFMSPLKLDAVMTEYARYGIDLRRFDYTDFLLDDGMLNAEVLHKTLEYAHSIEQRALVRSELTKGTAEAAGTAFATHAFHRDDEETSAAAGASATHFDSSLRDPW